MLSFILLSYCSIVITFNFFFERLEGTQGKMPIFVYKMSLYIIIMFNNFMIFHLLINIFHEILFDFFQRHLSQLTVSQILKPTHFCIRNSFTEVKACNSINFELPNLWDNTFYWPVKGEIRKCIKHRQLYQKDIIKVYSSLSKLAFAKFPSKYYFDS